MKSIILLWVVTVAANVHDYDNTILEKSQHEFEEKKACKCQWF